MADRYDPKLSVRPLSERRPAAPSDEDDPLVELARIVSGRSTFDPAPAAKNKTVPVGGGGYSVDPSLANDLESELLNDLQASFAVIREPAAPPPAQAKPAPAPARPAAAAPKPAPSVPPKPAPVVAAAPRPAPVPPKPAPTAPVARQAQPQLPSAEKPARPQERPAAPPPRAEKPAALAAPRAERPSPPPATPERPTVRPVERGDFANVPLRSTTQPHAPDVTLPAASATRCEKPEEAAVESESPDRFAPPQAKNWFRPASRQRPAAEPPRARALQPVPEPEIEPGDIEEFADNAAFAEADDGYQDDFALEDIAAYGDDDELPPLVDDLPDMGHRRPARGLLIVGALLVVALAGGVGFLTLRGTSGSTTAPPVITADPSPTKVAPAADSTATADAQNKLIYDRVDPAAKPSDDTNLVTPGDQQIADVQTPSADQEANPVSRVIIQGGPGYDSPADGTEAQASGDAGAAPAVTAAGAPAADASAAPAATDNGIGPRKVRTVVVRPDGTIVSSEAAPADGSGAPAVAAASKPPSEVAGSLAIGHGGTSMDTVLDKGGSIPVDSDPLAVKGSSTDGAAAVASATPAEAGTVPAGDSNDPQPVHEDAGAAAQASAAPATPDVPATATQVASAEPVQPPAPPAKPAAKPKPVVVAKGEPIDLTPASKPAAKPATAPADTASAAAASGGGLLVQVTSQKSEQGALSAYRGMQSRYAQVLGRYQPNVQRADLGDRGVYYRVRVGPFAGDGAQRVCTALKEAGGDCIIVR